MAEAGVADALDGRPRTTAELAGETGLDCDALARLLNLLQERGLFRREADDRWAHTDASQMLQSDHPESLRSYARMAGAPVCWGSVTHLEHALRTGEPGITRLHAGGTFAYLASQPDESRVFQSAMTSKARADIVAALAAHDFARYRSVCDIGGGQGHLLDALVEAQPEVRGILFELPEVARTARPVEGVEIVAGDFLVDALPLADAYVLMNVIHGWDDDSASRILSSVAHAGRSSRSTVLIFESVMPEGREPHPSRTLDVLMLASTGGRERTLTEYSRLLGSAGLALVGSTPLPTGFSIIEARAG
ncbi:MAG TPA: methyltransferase [Candidatus Dormibacteraeota bacterium]